MLSKLFQYAIFFLIISFTRSLSCYEEKESPGPLTHFKEFEIVLFFSPYENYDKELLTNFILDHFKEFTNVKTKESLPSANSKPILFISIGGERGQASLDVIGDVKVAQNGFDLACPIWSTVFYDENLPFPVIEKDGITFKRKDEKLGTQKDDLENALQSIIKDFEMEYQKSNPNGTIPSLYLSRRNCFKSIGQEGNQIGCDDAIRGFLRCG